MIRLSQHPYVVAVCTSTGGIPKHLRDWVAVNENGLEGDGHNHAKHNTPLQAVSLQDIEVLEDLRPKGYPLYPGRIGENMTVRNLDVQSLSLGTVLEFSGGVVLELSRERKPCYVLDSISPDLKRDILGRCGMYAKVVKPGIIRVGECITVASSCRGGQPGCRQAGRPPTRRAHDMRPYRKVLTLDGFPIELPHGFRTKHIECPAAHHRS